MSSACCTQGRGAAANRRASPSRHSAEPDRDAAGRSAAADRRRPLRNRRRRLLPAPPTPRRRSRRSIPRPPSAAPSCSPRPRQGDVAPTDTIFLVARRIADNPSARGTLVAVKRLSAASFPIHFTLSARDMMIPTGAFDGEVSLAVRVDKDGDPMTRRKGDVFGGLPKVTVGARGGQADARPAAERGRIAGRLRADGRRPPPRRAAARSPVGSELAAEQRVGSVRFPPAMPDYNKLREMVSHRTTFEFDTGAKVVGYIGSCAPAQRPGTAGGPVQGAVARFRQQHPRAVRRAAADPQQPDRLPRHRGAELGSRTRSSPYHSRPSGSNRDRESIPRHRQPAASRASAIAPRPRMRLAAWACSAGFATGQTARSRSRRRGISRARELARILAPRALWGARQIGRRRMASRCLRPRPLRHKVGVR